MVAYKKWGSQEAVEANPIDELLKLYVRINAEIENDPSLDEKAAFGSRSWKTVTQKQLSSGNGSATKA